MFILDFMEFAVSKFHFDVSVFHTAQLCWSVFSTLSKALVAVRSGAETSSKAPGNTRRVAQLSFEKILGDEFISIYQYPKIWIRDKVRE